jgi:putative ABC transport system permease protein
MRTRWRRLRPALGTGWVTLTGTGAAASIAFGLLVFASVLASLAIPRESAGLRTGALQRVIAASQPGDWAVTGTAVMESTVTGVPIEASATDMATAGASLRSQLAAAGMPIASGPPAWSGLAASDVQVTGAARAAGYGQPQFDLVYRTALARYGRVVAGRLPAGGSAGVVQVAATAATAARFGLRVGTRLNAGPMPMVVTGIIRPELPASAFWSTDHLAATPLLAPATSAGPAHWAGTLFTGPGALPVIEAGLDPIMTATWWYPAALGQLTAGQAGGLETGLGSLTASGATMNASGSPVAVTITSQIPPILSPFIAEESAVGPVLELLYVSLAVLGAVVVLLGAQLVAQRRAGEFTLIRARGAALHQLGWLVLRSSVVIAAAAGAAATVLAIAATPGDGNAAGWWLAGITIAVTLTGPVLISVIPQRGAAPLTGRGSGAARRAAGRKPAARRIVVEALLITAAVGGLAVLRSQGTGSGNGGLYSSAAPVLVAIPVAVVVLRCYPPLARELARMAGLARGVVAFVGLARATRRPPGTVLLLFALVLVLAMVAFPAMVTTSVTRSQVAASWDQVGADAIVQAQSGQVITPALQRQISAVPGVASTADAVLDAGFLPSGTELPVLFADPAQYAAVVAEAPGPRFPVAALAGGAGRGQTPATVPAVATAAAAQLVGTAPASVNVGATTITIRVAGRVGSVPGASAVAGGAAVVVPLQALGPDPPGPDLLLVAGSGLDGARLTQVVHSALPDAVVTLRSTALAALATAPVPQAAAEALTQGMATAAGFGVLVLLLSLLLSARTRELTLTRMATMGLRRWQAELMLAAEALPPVVGARHRGVAGARVLVPLVGPSVSLAAFGVTGSVAIAVVPLAASAAGLVVAALLVLAVQAAISYQRGSARALRITD